MALILVCLTGLFLFEILLLTRRRQGIAVEILAALPLGALTVALFWPERSGGIPTGLYMLLLVGSPMLVMVGLNEILTRMKQGLALHLVLILFSLMILAAWIIYGGFYLGCNYYQDC